MTVRADQQSPPAADMGRLSGALPAVLLTTFASFCALYAPQPLLPLLGQQFGVSASSTAWLISVPFLFLCVAPLGYGLLLQHMAARQILTGAAVLLGLSQIALAHADSFSTMLVIRVFQSALFPALFTAAVTYAGQSGEAAGISRRISLYIATTIVGGLCGRLIGGVGGDLLGWSTAFDAVGVALVLCGVLLWRRVQALPSGTAGQARAADLFNTLCSERYRSGLLLIAIVFFVFSGTLNVLPFRLVALDPEVTAAQISLVYMGYLAGVVIALNVKFIVEICGGLVSTLRCALAVFVVGLLLLGVPQTLVLIAIGFLTCSGMFLTHTCLSAYLNSLDPSRAGVVNGVYIATYYAAGATGSVLSVWVYEHAGWPLLLSALVAVALCGLWPLAALAGRNPAGFYRDRPLP